MKHDRYLIYKLLGREVEVQMAKRAGGSRLRGVVERVFRDIFSLEVKVTIGGQTHSFREPTAIVSDGVDVHFVYGSLDLEDDGLEYNAWNEDLHQHLKRTTKTPEHRTVFRVGDVQETPRERWRTRAAVA